MARIGTKSIITNNCGLGWLDATSCMLSKHDQFLHSSSSKFEKLWCVILLTWHFDPYEIQACWILQGDLSFLPPPQKTESQTWGEFLDSVFFLHPMSGTLFFWGVARRISHPHGIITPWPDVSYNKVGLEVICGLFFASFSRQAKWLALPAQLPSWWHRWPQFRSWKPRLSSWQSWGRSGCSPSWCPEGPWSTEPGHSGPGIISLDTACWWAITAFCLPLQD